MPGAVFLEGERVTLRTVERADVSFLHRWSNDPATRRATGEQSVPLTLEEETEYYEAYLDDEDAVLLLVCLGEESIGAVDLAVTETEADVAEIAYWLVPDRRGGGYAREATTLLLGYAFEELGMHRVHAETFAFNESSIRLLDRLGFVREGRLRENHFADGRHYDTLVFGLLDREWRRRSGPSRSVTEE